MQRNVRAVQVQYNLRRRRTAVQERVHQQLVHGIEIRNDLPVLRRHRPRRRQFQTVQRALARKRGAIRPRRLRLPQHRPDRRILLRPVMVVEILPARRQRKQPLPNQRLHRVHRQKGTARVPETIRQPRVQIQSVVRKAEQDHTAIRGQRSARNIDVNPLLPVAPGKWTTEHIILPLRTRGGNPLRSFNCLLLNEL